MGNQIQVILLQIFPELTELKINETNIIIKQIDMKKATIYLLLSFALFESAVAKDITWTTSGLKMSVNDKGYVTSLFDVIYNKEYLPEGNTVPLLSIRCNGEIEHPVMLKSKGRELTLTYEKNKVYAKIAVVAKSGYLTFELADIIPFEKIDLVIWGPYPTTISETIGECVGVVRNSEFALGIQVLNVKTLGGYPTEESDIEPSYNIFEENPVDIKEDWKKQKLYRGQTAKSTDHGSILQAYCRNRLKDRVISNWGHEKYIAPAFDDGGVKGSKIALFGCPSDKALLTIGEIEVAEGLPHPVIDGEWGKTARSATASYLIIDFGEESLDKAIELTKKAGLKYLYHGGPFDPWGHFKLYEKAFPGNWESMKRCVEKAKAQEVRLGVHTLSNFITTNDPYVTPVPDKRLAKVGETVLTNSINASTEEIGIESPDFFNQMGNNTLHSVVIGDEIIRYREVSESAPWKLMGCVRGAYGTKAEQHNKSEKIGKLMDHPYKVFLSDASLSEEIAVNIAKLFNETGLLQTSFDGLEGVWSTGMGQYARNLFTKIWYDHLDPEIKGKVINDASNPGHFNWHINTRYNWGEPWYAGFRESQTSYRLMHQDFFSRNLLPHMLGWFSMNPQTSIEDAEWLLARAAGFDAGFAFNLSLRNVEANGQSNLIFDAIRIWETARMAGAFTPEQKTRMQDIKNEFHLEQVGENNWDLYPYHIERFDHEQKIRQPGEPVHSIFNFDNPYEGQALMFLITLTGDQDAVSPVEGITIEINNYSTVDIPVRMQPAQILKLDGKGILQLFDKNWTLIKTIDAGKIPLLAKGKNSIMVDAGFTTEGTSKLKIEVKTIGKPESISIK